MIRSFVKILLTVFLFASTPMLAQYNPYLRKKAKNKPSAKIARANRKEMKRQNRIAKRQMRRSRKRTGR